MIMLPRKCVIYGITTAPLHLLPRTGPTQQGKNTGKGGLSQDSPFLLRLHGYNRPDFHQQWPENVQRPADW